MLEELREHVGRRAEIADQITSTAIRRLGLTLDRDLGELKDGMPIPPGWHGIFCIWSDRTAALSEDGLPRSPDILPEIPLPRRMFGGARMRFHAPLRVGDPIVCTSEIADIKQRPGSGGDMVIVVQRHSFSSHGTLKVVEEQDIIHLPATPPSLGNPPPPKMAPGGSDLSETIQPDPRLLFRFSALTFNSHRIHYDLPYAREIEHLPALMVQGKLLAMMLLGLVEKLAPKATLQEFSYRSVRPVFADRPFTIACKQNRTEGTVALWAADADGALAQTASAKFSNADS
jgi:3-methylfumaryl-CoA hydratase